jgi:Ni/Fe-hydrogenase subunit HybB-like protein
MIRTLTERRLLTPGMIVLGVLGAAGLVLIAWRFAAGLGAVTNLSDGYPWGFWIGIDILAGIALASGGFVMAGLVHLFGGHRFHPLARPAILTALLGYLLFIGALAVDLGRPWNIWQALIHWNHVSPMFEVSWCVTFYTFVLMLEFAPAVFERLRWSLAQRLWAEIAPILIAAMVALFTLAMTTSTVWAVGIAAVLAGWEILMRLGVMRRDQQMPVLLIMAGILFSAMHQSSLGTLFLITDKLGPLFYSPILPFLFLLSAVMVAPAMVIVEATASARVRRRKVERVLLTDLARGMPYLLTAYLVVRVGDILARGLVLEALQGTFATGWWWLETALLLTALALFATPELGPRGRALLPAAGATVLALIVNRTGVAIVGLDVPEYARYVPAWPEVLITVGILSLGLIAFRFAAEFLPVYESEPDESLDVVPITAGAHRGLRTAKTAEAGGSTALEAPHGI